MEKTWIMVADARRARLFCQSGGDEPWREMSDYCSEDRLETRDLEDLPGRGLNRGNGGHFAMVSRVDPREHAVRDFADSLVEVLEKGRAAAEFDDLTLIAPAHFLGLLKRRLSRETGKCLTQTLSLDLTRCRASDIQRRLAPASRPQRAKAAMQPQITAATLVKH